ncbi:DNA cytosine methyltransferase [Ruegeria sp. Ofav3-42]|uniref:DNA cytosine methyltransferase n=1 Tax=Ruegeria sp. Ofav3-42 TaxID=2917759 RepID=UPI001EF6ED37|nr:DNA cytosine methyltransferase [Ruegeria sp. Ofav3-42]MCG7520872.1 DNA cytosine methyltransferase [Ruegeria sp. Ofav3-42]
MSCRPMIIDSFAGGGGASTGIELALDRSPDVAINHDPRALSMHEANHPETIHLDSNIWDVEPLNVTQGRHVGLLWASPDCKHFSKAKGGAPRDRNIRDLAWVVVKWAEQAKPDVILLENVEEFRTWGPICDAGKPINGLEGTTYELWVKRLRNAGYKVQWRELRACDYGAPTIRKRFFMVARRDGRPIVWPAPTHGKPDSRAVKSGKLLPWRSAAEIIDWSVPCPSIFLTPDQAKEWGKANGQHPPKRPLAVNTLKRIARGIQRYVIDAKDPFFVTYGQHGGASRSPSDPLHTVTASIKDQNALVVPTLVQTGYGERKGQAPRVPGLDKPIGTMVAGGAKHALVAAFLAQHNAGPNNANLSGRPATAPLSTLTTTGAQQQIVAAHLMNMHGTGRSARDLNDPHPTICAGGGHGALVAAFLHKYYGTEQDPRLTDPLHTLTTKDRFGLITVEINGSTYAITDICMRMLTAREQFRAQGFPDTYNIDQGADGSAMTKKEQTRMCGNSVPPPIAAALASANCGHLLEKAGVA